MDHVTFRSYRNSDRSDCLRIFDANTPEFFAPNERQDYVTFLDAAPSDYRVCVASENVIGAFGVFSDQRGRVRLNWILIDPATHGRGVGSEIMSQVLATARSKSANSVLIAASHKSAPFFERFGAIAHATVEHGWGKDMHRVDMRLCL